MRSPRFALLAALFFLAAAPGPCGEDAGFVGDADGGGASSVTALYELSPSEFYALPFPNDLRRTAAGGIDLADHVRPNSLIATYLDLFSTHVAGFGTNSAVFVRFSGAIDASSLPATPQASLAATASVYLVNVDEDSPDYGRRVPLRYRFEPRAGEAIGPNWLSALPYPGFPLRGATTYALVVTRRLRGADGRAVLRGADFEAALGSGPANDKVTRARTTLAPLVEWLDAPGGDEVADVACATVYTTQDATSLMGKLRARVYETAEPTAREVVAGGGTSAYVSYRGVYDAPNFQRGDVPYFAAGGDIEVDDDGLPIVQRTEALRFAVTFPKTTMPAAGWPIVLYAHGTGGDWESFIDDGTAGRMAAEGLAAISIDQVLHGPRDPSGTDPDVTFFNFQNPLAARDNVRQGAADDFQLLRLARRLEAGGNKVDPTKIYFMGHSQGGLTGPPFLAYEPDVKGAVLSGAGGLIYFSLLYKTKPEPSVAALVKSFLRDEPLDEFNNVLALVQMFIEPADPQNYAPLLSREPVAGVAAKDIYQSEGITDNFTPLPNLEAFGVAMGLAPVAPVLRPVAGFALRGQATLTAPVTGNLNGRTGVFLQYDASAISDGHFVVFRVPAAQRQHAKFLGSLAQTGVATLVP